MAFNIAEFKARGLTRGGFRPSNFKVRFSAVPPGIPNASNDLEYMCRSAQLPPSIIQPIEVSYFGRPIKVAGTRIFPDWTVSVICDEDMRHRNMFEAWHNKINALKSNRQDSDPDALLDYKVSAEVLAYGKAGPGDDSGVIRAYQFEGMWPSNVDGINLDWEGGNQIATFDVTFSYDLWEPTVFHPSIQPYSGTLAPDPLDGTGGSFPIQD